MKISYWVAVHRTDRNLNLRAKTHAELETMLKDYDRFWYKPPYQVEAIFDDPLDLINRCHAKGGLSWEQH